MHPAHGAGRAASGDLAMRRPHGPTRGTGRKIRKARKARQATAGNATGAAAGVAALPAGRVGADRPIPLCCSAMAAMRDRRLPRKPGKSICRAAMPDIQSLRY
jgi:hypothetical protein